MAAYVLVHFSSSKLPNLQYPLPPSAIASSAAMASAALSIASLSLQGNKGFSEFAGLRRSSASLFSGRRTSEDFASAVAFQTSASGGRMNHRRGPVEAKLKVAINGFGRTGRNFVRCLQYWSRSSPQFDIIAINDIAGPERAAHLLKYDSNFVDIGPDVKTEGNTIYIKSKQKTETVKIFSESDPAKLPWKDLGIDLVIEATGLFVDREGAGRHLHAGAKKVMITEPGAGDIPAYIVGVNTGTYNPNKPIISSTSPTTVCVAPLLKILNHKFGIKKGSMTIIQSYTNEQKLVDSHHDSDPRLGRAAAANIVPTTTTAATAVAQVLPCLKGKLDGLAFRVPTPNVSAVDLVLQVCKKTTAEKVKFALRRSAQNEGALLAVCEEPLTSVDFWATNKPTVDTAFTMALGENQGRNQSDMIKVVAWYDNEWAYAMKMIDLADFIAKNKK